MTSQLLLECPRCLAETLVIRDSKVCCASCGYECPIHECPKCEKMALVDRGYGQKCPTGPQFACFSCGSHWQKGDLEHCPECGRLQLYADFEELIICRSSVGFFVCRKCYEKIFLRET